MITTLLKPFASLRLTVTLLALSIVVVFAGTWAQIDQGIWQVQERYFHSFFCWIDFQLFFKRPAPGQSAIPGGFPMLGGYSLIILLLINLLAAHSLRFKFTTRRLGIILLHLGLILLLCGEVVTSLFAVESQMTIREGQSANFSQDIRECELALVDPSPADHDNVAVIPQERLARKGTITDPRLAFSITVDEFHENSIILGPVQAGAKKDARATAGSGVGLTVVGQPRVPGTDAGQIDVPSCYVTLMSGGRALGTYLVSPFLDEPQQVEVDGKVWNIGLRFRRLYKPYTIHLHDFTHAKFTGTDTPKDFASEIRLVDPTKGVDREVRIWMNHPLRYGGETFYQASFLEGDSGTVLQVVENPGWLIPYISCSLVTLGLLVHFGILLVGFLQRRLNPATTAPAKRRSPAQQTSLGGWVWPGIITAGCAVYLLSVGRPPPQTGKVDVSAFARVPVSYQGRVMPMDSLARNTLRIISGRSQMSAEMGVAQPAANWLLDVITRPNEASDYKVFRIDHPDLKGVLKLDDSRTRFSYRELIAQGNVLNEQARLAFSVDEKKRDLYQKKTLELVGHLNLVQAIGQLDDLFLAPPMHDGEDWKTFADAVKRAETGAPNPGVEALRTMIASILHDKPDLYTAAAGDYAGYLRDRQPGVASRIDFELMFNRIEPFIQSMYLYVLVFLLVLFYWLTGWKPLATSALWVLVLTLILHTLGLVARIYISQRPPVTNLYSSAVFIAWGAVLFCVFIELIYRNGVASGAAAVIAFPSLLIAHYLAADGDTMAMLQAVLDTNLWLATHVVVVTLGYTATFLAGILAAIFIIGGVLTRALNPESQKTLSRMIYGVLCFAMLFSFVGTVLGGIWADQSWGRFWGWDAKENGAVLIVLWNAIILHARWGGLVQTRGVANMALFGNIVTSWSWFGTNMLGVGLHSYGFMDSALFWLGLWIAINLLLIGLGSLPVRYWRSNAGEPHRVRGAMPAAM